MEETLQTCNYFCVTATRGRLQHTLTSLQRQNRELEVYLADCVSPHQEQIDLFEFVKQRSYNRHFSALVMVFAFI